MLESFKAESVFRLGFSPFGLRCSWNRTENSTWGRTMYYLNEIVSVLTLQFCRYIAILSIMLDDKSFTEVIMDL